VAGLGNIFEPETSRPRGPDLRCKVKVPQRALGRDGGVEVEVPLELEHEGRAVARATSPHDDPRKVRLHLPDSLPEGAVLRLRGQGGLRDGGAPGDLYVEVEVTGGAPLGAVAWVGVALAAGAVLAAVLAYV
jgi:hypothetical protein